MKTVRLICLVLALAVMCSAQSLVMGTGVNAGSVNAQTGTTYTVLAGDQGKLVTLSNASPVAVTLPQATGQFGAGWFAWVTNLGAGTVTISPTTSTIDGSATLALTQNQGAVIFSDGTNYQLGKGASAAGGTAANYFQIGGVQSGSSWAIGSANQIRMNGFGLPVSLTFSKILYKVTVIDATGSNKYDIGIYDSAGNLKANIGPTSMTTLGYFNGTITQTSVTLAPGYYYFALTGVATTAAIDQGAGSSCTTLVSNQASASTSTAGTLPSTATIPSTNIVTYAEGMCGHLALNN